MTWVAWEAASSLAAKALAAGAILRRPGLIDWDIAPRCEEPRYVEVRAKPWKREREFVAEIAGVRFTRSPALAALLGCLERGHPGITVRMDVKCRGCDRCLRERQWLWSSKARNELRRAERTWFGTLTLSPGNVARAMFQAHSKEARAGVDIDRLSEGERFQAIHSVISAEITKYLKRVRKVTGARLRYLLVAEAHKSGIPHYHILLHEQRSGWYESKGVRTWYEYKGVPYRILRQQWSLGWSKFNLAEPADAGTAIYLCKYLGKEKRARVRASLQYGAESAWPALAPEGTEGESLPCPLPQKVLEKGEGGPIDLSMVPITSPPLGGIEGGVKPGSVVCVGNRDGPRTPQTWVWYVPGEDPPYF